MRPPMSKLVGPIQTELFFYLMLARIFKVCRLGGHGVCDLPNVAGKFGMNPPWGL